MTKHIRQVLFFLAVALFAAVAQAVTLVVEVSWNSPYGSGQGIDPTEDPYHLQDGSIVQIIGYNSQQTGVHGPDDVDNGGMTQYSTVDGDPPVPVLLPNTVAEGWTILAETHAVDTGTTGAGDMEYFTTTVVFDLPYNVDTIFVRIFSNTGFPDDGTMVSGYWGTSDTQNVADFIGLGFTWFDDIENPNFAYFEVIPEPATTGLLACGAGVLALWARRRKKGKGDPS